MAMQMGITIGLFVFIGLKLDLWLETKVVFTLVLSLFGVGAALYYFIKKAISDNDT
jgi:F0F1-type ATP synthase assembly protein I